MLETILKEERLKKGLTQVDLAKIFNVSKQTVSNWESGKRTPDAETIQTLADFYGVSVDYLLGRVKKNVNFMDVFNELIDDHCIKIGTYYPNSNNNQDNKYPSSIKELLNMPIDKKIHKISQKDIDLYRKYSSLSDTGKKIVEMMIEELSNKKEK